VSGTGPGVGSPHLVLAVDIGGSEIKAELLDEGHATLAAATAATPPPVPGCTDGGPVLAAVTELARTMLRDAPAPVRGVGLAVPGLVDVAAGRGLLSVNLGWHDVEVREVVAAALRLPVAVEHDVTAAGLAERALGAAAGVDDVLVVVLGTGISAVVFANGQLVRGGRGQAGELGHLRVVSGGPPCNCGGVGCVEAVAGARAIATAYAERAGRPVRGARDVVARAAGGDPVAVEVWDAAVGALAEGVLAAVGLLGSTRVVLGGGLSAAGPALFDPLRAQLSARRSEQTLPDVVPAALGVRAGTVGAGLAIRAALGAAQAQPSR